MDDIENTNYNNFQDNSSSVILILRLVGPFAWFTGFVYAFVNIVHFYEMGEISALF
jgi:hypothetical protein